MKSSYGDGESHGDWEPGSQLFSVQEKRRKFMDVVVELEPAVMENLREAYDELAKDRSSWSYPNRPAALNNWCTRWWLNDPWCYDWTIERFRDWANLPPRWDNDSIEGLFERWNKAGGSISLGVPPVISYVPSPIHWPMAIERESVFRKRATDQFCRELKAYIEGCHKKARAAGARPMLLKRQHSHFYWLARYQVKGEKVAEIARSHAHLKPGAF